MKHRKVRLIRRALRALGYSAVGALVVLVVGYVYYLNSRADLAVWHLAELDEEFSADSDITVFSDYLALEERLFRQLEEEVYARVPPEERTRINRYHRGSLADPHGWSTNWNRTFELAAASPRAGVLLLHGMSDSPYSLRHLGERFNAEGAHVLGLRMPGHGTAPSGLVNLAWEDMAAAVRLAMHHLAEKVGDRPIHIVGYSTGAAVAVLYVLDTLEDATLPRAQRLVVLSPAIGVTSVAALAVWQARLGHLLGLDKLAWTDILPEYDPFKYGSFAVNAGDVVYRLTEQIQRRITALGEQGRLGGLPPILAFSSVVDATVSTPALVRGLFERLPPGGHELVLFDINRMAKIEPILKWNPTAVVEALKEDPHPAFTLSLVTNEHPDTLDVAVHRWDPGEAAPRVVNTGLSWSADLYSLAHGALPFPPDDALYGGHPKGENPGLQLGAIALRGERGVLQIGAADMLRLRWNPFYAYVEARVLGSLGMDTPAEEASAP
jgi:alpha-beta hydrolase superfamily lysophospholipase